MVLDGYVGADTQPVLGIRGSMGDLGPRTYHVYSWGTPGSMGWTFIPRIIYTAVMFILYYFGLLSLTLYGGDQIRTALKCQGFDY